MSSKPEPNQTDEFSIHTPADTAVDLSAVDPFDPSLFQVTATAAAMSTRKMLSHCRVGRPSKTSFVRASDRPEDTMNAAILELKDENETYLVVPSVAAGLPGLVSFCSLTVGIDRQGNPFLWVVKGPNLDGKDNDWNRSMREAQAAAKKRWVRIESNRAAGGYDVFEAAAGISDPEWPSHTLQDYVRVGFGEGFVIRDVSNPVVQRLLGAA
jgi:hypothetical protein